MIKQFVFNALLTENSLDQLSAQGIAVRGNAAVPPIVQVDEIGFSPRILYEATKMSSVFMAFYCLENAVRELITERLLSRKGTDWWNIAVPGKIKTSVEKLKDKET